MLHKSFKPVKCKTSLKLSASRTKLLKYKKDAQIKQLRREVAQLLDSGQVQTARIRVEHVIREEKTMGAYYLIEIYCELIAARLPIIESQKNCPVDLKEAIASVVFASPRCADVPELVDVRKHFQAKYGKDFISASVELRPDCGVNRSLVEKLSAKTPDISTKLKILTAIAEEHDIKWNPNSFGGNDTTSQDVLLKGPSTFEKASRMHEEPPNVHMPYNTQAAPSVYIGSHKVANAESMKNFNARASFGRQNIPPSPEHFSTPANSHLEMKSSGNVVEGSEARRRYSGDSNINCMDRPDWNMEFTDATTAAQAAAESAERASIAARAAAELSSRGRVPPSYVLDPHGFRDERLERPSVLHPPGEGPPKSQVNNASVGRNSGLAYDHVDASEENLAQYHKSYNPPRKSSSYKSNPDVGSMFHGGPVSGDNTFDRTLSDADCNQGDHSEEDDSLSEMTKKLHGDAYKKSSNSNESHVGAVVGDVDAFVYEQRTAVKYTEVNPWSAGLENNGGISERRCERKNSFGEANRTRSSEIHDRKDSGESFVEFTPDVQESYGYKKDSDRASTRSQSSCSSSFTGKQGFSGLSNENAESGLAENLFADYDEEKISTRNKSACESSVVFDDYGSDNDVDVFDLDKGPKSSFTVSPPLLVEAEQSDNFNMLGHEGISAEFSDTSASAEHYSQGKHSSIFAETLPGAKAASETEENLPVTFDDLGGPCSENEDEPEKSSEPRRIDDTGYKNSIGSSKFSPVGEAEVVNTSLMRPNILHASGLEQEVASDTGSGLAFGSLTGGFRNKSHVPPLYAWTETGKDSWSNQRRDNPGFSPPNLTSTDKASDEAPDIHYVDDQVKSRPNMRMQMNFTVSHEVTVPQPKMGSRPVAYGDDDEEEDVVELDPNYWRKLSTRPAKNDSVEKTRFRSQSSLASDSDGNTDVAKGHQSPVSSEKSHARAVAGLSQRTKTGSSSTYHSASRKPTTDSGESGGRRDAESSGFSPRSTVAGANSAKPKARTNMHDSSESSGNLKWRSEAKDKKISDTAKDKIVNNQSLVPSGKVDTTESSKPAKPSLDSTSREDSFKRASHVHPKMPDYETFLSNLKSLRANRQ